MKTINQFTWFFKRELDFMPQHFVVAQTILTPESKRWIEETLVGRWYLYNDNWKGNCPAFEDPHEAVLYELTWS